MSTSRSAFHETHCKAPIFVMKALKASAGKGSLMDSQPTSQGRSMGPWVLCTWRGYAAMPHGCSIGCESQELPLDVTTQLWQAAACAEAKKELTQLSQDFWCSSIHSVFFGHTIANQAPPQLRDSPSALCAIATAVARQGYINRLIMFGS